MMEEKAYLLDLVVRDKSAYQFLSDAWRGDMDVARASIEKHGNTLAFAPLHMKLNPELAQLAVKESGVAIEFVHPDLKASDLALCIAAVGQNSNAINLLPEAMRTHPDVLLALLACPSSGYRMFIRYAPRELLRKVSFMLRVVRLNGRLLEFAPERIYMNPKVASAAANQCGRFAFRHIQSCFLIPEVLEALERIQATCESNMDAYLRENDQRKKARLYWNKVRYDVEFGVKSVRSDELACTPHLIKDTIRDVEPDGIRVFMMSDDFSLDICLDHHGNDPLKIDAIFHSENTHVGEYSYSLAVKLKNELHLRAAMAPTLWIDSSSTVSVYEQTKLVFRAILMACKENNWHRIRLTNFTNMAANQFGTLLAIGEEVKSQENQMALSIYMDIDPSYVKGQFRTNDDYSDRHY